MRNPGLERILRCFDSRPSRLVPLVKELILASVRRTLTSRCPHAATVP